MRYEHQQWANFLIIKHIRENLNKFFQYHLIYFQATPMAEIFFRITLALAGLVHVLPTILAFAPSKIPKSYGIEVPDANYELLLRHRACLFGIVGGLLIFSAITKRYYETSTIVGLVSMISFIALYFIVGNGVNAELSKVMKIDLVALILLLVGCFLKYQNQ
jgi:hypothetical protein